jgi:hypothetical protein
MVLVSLTVVRALGCHHGQNFTSAAPMCTPREKMGSRANAMDDAGRRSWLARAVRLERLQARLREPGSIDIAHPAPLLPIVVHPFKASKMRLGSTPSIQLP